MADGLGAFRHAREQVQPLDVLLRRPRLARIRIVGRADVAAVAHGRLHHQRHPGVGTAHRDGRAEERRRRNAHDRERRAVDGEGLADRVRRARETPLPVPVADDHDRVTVERAIVVGRQEPSSLRPLPEHVEVFPRDQLDGAALARRPRPSHVPDELHSGHRARGRQFGLPRQLVAEAASLEPREPWRHVVRADAARLRTSDRARPPGGCAARSHSAARRRQPRRRSRGPATRPRPS